MSKSNNTMMDLILRHVPADGSLVGNIKLKKIIQEIVT
jgi:hypothetical protein